MDLPDNIVDELAAIVAQSDWRTVRGCSRDILSLATCCRRLHKLVDKHTLRRVDLWQRNRQHDMEDFLSYAARFPRRLSFIRSLKVECRVESLRSIFFDDSASGDSVGISWEDAQAEHDRRQGRALVIWSQIAGLLAQTPHLQSLHLGTFGGWVRSDEASTIQVNILASIKLLRALQHLHFEVAPAQVHFRDVLVQVPVGIHAVVIGLLCGEGEAEQQMADQRLANVPLQAWPDVQRIDFRLDAATRITFPHYIDGLEIVPWAQSLQWLSVTASGSGHQDLGLDPSSLWRRCQRLDALTLIDVKVDAALIARLPSALERLDLWRGELDGKALATSLRRGAFPRMTNIYVTAEDGALVMGMSQLKALEVRILANAPIFF